MIELKNKKSQEEKEAAIKLWQSICKHNGAILSNTGEEGSKCARCGKVLYPNNPNIS